jgi:hypothetical protein
MRSACDFCHTKRIKCKPSEPGSKTCQQCASRNIECKFSLKEKTGPKPKTGRAARSRSNSPPAGSNSSNSPTHSQRSRYDSSSKADGAYAPTRSGSSSQQRYASAQKKGGPADIAATAAAAAGAGNDVQYKATPYPKTAAEQIQQETLYLSAYLSTVAQLLPFCDTHSLGLALAARAAVPVPSACLRLSWQLRWL